MLDYFLFAIYKIFKYIVLLLPKFMVKFFLDKLAYFIYLINYEHKKYAKANLDLVYENRISHNRKMEIIKNAEIFIGYRNIDTDYAKYDFEFNSSAYAGIVFHIR